MKIKFIYCVYCLFLLTACEYKIHENFVDIEKPQEEINVSVDLNTLHNGQAILINKTTRMDYSLSAFGKDIKSVRFKLGDQVWDYQDMQANGSIYIGEEQFPSGSYTLECDFMATSGSGSIADQMGQEGYTGQMSWPVIIDYDMELPNTVSYRTNEDGFLELSWGLPVMSHLKVSSYTVTCNSGGEQRTINVPADNTYFVDRNHVGNAATYQVGMNLSYEGSSNLYWQIGELEMPEEAELFVSSWDLEKINIRWKLPYTCHASFSINDGDPFDIVSGQDSISVPVISFGSISWNDLNNIVLNLASVDAPSQVLCVKQMYAGSPGIYHEQERMKEWIYNPVTDLLYVAALEQLNAYHSFDIAPYLSRQVSPGFPNLYSSMVSDKIAFVNDRRVDILNGRTLSVEQTFDLSSFFRIVGFTHDDKFMYFTYNEDGYHNVVHVCNLDGTIVADIPAAGHAVILSSDSKYLCYMEYSEVKLLALDNYKVTKEYTLPVPFVAQDRLLFNPLRPDELIVPYNNEHRVEVRRCPDYSLIREFSLADEMEVSSIDPVTGNLLVNNSTHLLVVSAQTGKSLLTLKAPYYIWPSLKGNNLISQEGYVLNIEKYLQQ